MTAKSERVKQMKLNFMKLHNEGYSIKEIAEKFHITPRTIYSELSAIAEENGIPREELLSTPHKQHSSRGSTIKAHQESVNPNELKANFEKMIDTANIIIEKIDYVLQQEENTNYEKVK